MRLKEVLKPNREAARIAPNQIYKQITVRLHHKGVNLRAERMGRELRSKQYLSKSGQFIVSKIDARNGAMGLVPPELDCAVVTGDFLLYNIDDSVLLPEFFDYLTSHERFVKECSKASKGTTNRIRLKPEKFLEIEIVVPSVGEQKNIVIKIDKLRDRIGRLKAVKAEAMADAEEMMDSVVEETFGKLESTEKKRLAMLTSKIGSGSTPKGGRKSYPSSGIPFIRSLNVRMRKFQWEGIAFISRQTHNVMNGTQVQPNDVLLNITGASLGRVACVPYDVREANVNQHVSIIRPLEALDSRYLMYWLSQPLVQNMISEKQKGETREGLTKAQIEAFEIPVPLLDKQRHIVAYLDSIQEKVDQLQKLQNETEKDGVDLFPSILDRALAGEL